METETKLEPQAIFSFAGSAKSLLAILKARQCPICSHNRKV
jgi:hypothetical protein